MNSRQRTQWLFCVAAIGLCSLQIQQRFAPAQFQPIQFAQGGVGGAGNAQPEPPPRWPVRDRTKGIPLTLSPQAPGRPALEFALLPKVEETEKGNAAVKYLVAISNRPKEDEKRRTLLDEARQNAPLEALDPNEKEIREISQAYGTCLRFMRDGARLNHAEWETNLRREGYKALLPSLGALREVAQALALQIRLDIKRHDWPAAREKLKTGYALARHCNEGESLIESLIAAAIATMMNTCLEDWIAEPGAPNLYWPLANLPVPFIDLRRAMTFERATATFSLPELKKFREGKFSVDAWHSFAGQFAQMSAMAGGNDPYSMAGLGWKEQVAGTVSGIALYPEAKRFLIERGTSAADVDKMPVAEALERYFVRSFDETADDMFKWHGLPPAQAIPGLKQWEETFQQERMNLQVNPLARILVPSLTRALQLNMRLDRQISALRIAEAIRAHAAETGSLPDSLEALKLPLPMDPVGKPFEYQKTGPTAVLSSPPPQETPRDGIRYEITLRK